MAWTKVCLPKELGGLGISDLQNLGWALQLRWLWLMKTDPTHPWTNFHVPVHKCFQAFFSITVVSEIGYGAATLFWTDRWICGQSIADLAPQVLALVSKRKRNKRTVLEALADLTWVRDILDTLSALLIFFTQYFTLWVLISQVVLQPEPEVEDTHVWRFYGDGHYSPKSASMKACFLVR